jgi:hypothetical protein
MYAVHRYHQRRARTGKPFFFSSYESFFRSRKEGQKADENSSSNIIDIIIDIISLEKYLARDPGFLGL